MKNALDSLEKQIDQTAQQIQKEREQAALGGLEVEGAGLACLILGLALSAKPGWGVAVLRALG